MSLPSLPSYQVYGKHRKLSVSCMYSIEHNKAEHHAPPSLSTFLRSLYLSSPASTRPALTRPLPMLDAPGRRLCREGSKRSLPHCHPTISRLGMVEGTSRRSLILLNKTNLWVLPSPVLGLVRLGQLRGRPKTSIQLFPGYKAGLITAWAHCRRPRRHRRQASPGAQYIFLF
jgi:hypothetical protein